MLDDGGWELMAGVRDRLHPGTLSSPPTERYCSRDNAERGVLDGPEVGIDQPAHFMDMVGKIEAVTAVAGDDDNHVLLLNWFNKFIWFCQISGQLAESAPSG